MTRRLMGAALALVPVLAWGAPRQNVAIRAYINVSSGCQAATVDFINGLKTKYAPNVSLEMIDFGDRGKGTRAWQQSGHRCMTIELNGSSLVKFPYNGKMQAVAFQMPVGFNWTHADLEHAVQAGVRGELQPATAAEVEAAAPPQLLRATVTAGSTTANGRRYATVVINGQIAVYIPGATSQASQRANQAVSVLKGWLVRPVKLSQLTVQQVTGGWKVLAGGKGVITATAADAQVYGEQSRQVAEGWVGGIKHTLVGRPGG